MYTKIIDCAAIRAEADNGLAVIFSREEFVAVQSGGSGPITSCIGKYAFYIPRTYLDDHAIIIAYNEDKEGKFILPLYNNEYVPEAIWRSPAHTALNVGIESLNEGGIYLVIEGSFAKGKPIYVWSTTGSYTVCCAKDTDYFTTFTTALSTNKYFTAPTP